MAKSITDLKSELTHLVGAYRHQIEDTLVRKGYEVLGHLGSLARSTEWRKRAAFCRISGEIANRSTRNKDEKKKDDWVYEGEDRHLIKTEILKALPLLADLLGDEHLWVRYRSAEALMKFGEEASFATSKLMGMIDDTDPWVRQIVIKAIGEIEKDPLKLSEAAHKALMTSNTSFGVSRNAYAIMKETQGDSDGRLDAIVSFLENLPHGYGAKRALKPLMEMGVKLDPEGKKMIPILLKGISTKPGFDHQRLNGRELGMKTLATYGEKVRYTVPKLQGLLKEYSGNKGFVKAIQEFLGKLGVEDLIEEKP